MKQKKMTSENVLNFDVHGPRMSMVLTYTKLLKNNSLSKTSAIIGTFATGFLLIMSILITLSEIINVKNSYDLPTFTTHVNPMLFHLGGTIKWIVCINQIDDISELNDRMKRCHQLCLKINKNDKDHHVYRMKINKIRKEMSIFATGYFTLLIYGVIQWCLNPVFYDFYNDIYGVKEMNSSFSRHLPYPGVFPWKVDNHKKYIGTFIFQLISSLGSAIGHGSCDIMNITFLDCACQHFRYLGETLTDQRDNALIFSDNLVAQKFENKLRNCIKHHRELLKFVAKLRKTTSIPLFTVCLQSTLALCLVSLQAATMKIDSSIESIMIVLSLVELWSGVNIQLFVYCFFATKIQGLGLDAADAIYACDWEQTLTPSWNQHENSINEHQRAITNINRMIEFSLMRAQKPIIIHGGIFYILSLETYKSLTGLSLSNALILRQVSEEG